MRDRSIIGAAVVWMALTIVGQFQRFAPHRARMGMVGWFLPNWRFFAPRPGSHDYHILVRDKLRDGSVLRWQELPITSRRRPLHAVWHPRRRVEKAVFDCVQDLLQFIDTDVAMSELQFSRSYLVILSYVSRHRSHVAGAVATQFLIAQSAGSDHSEEPVTVFSSMMHALDTT